MIYEYFCPIHNTFEVSQKITEESLTLCPKCQEQNVETPVKRLLSATNFILQGGGWASSGYSNK